MEISEETNSSITTYDTSVADNTGTIKGNHQVISSQPRNASSDVNYTDPDCGIVFNKSPRNALKDILVWPQPKNTKKKRVQTERLLSEKWLEVIKAKEEEKQRRLEKKEEEKKIRLQKREEAKQIKLAKRIKLEKRDEAKSKKKAKCNN